MCVATLHRVATRRGRHVERGEGAPAGVAAGGVASAAGRPYTGRPRTRITARVGGGGAPPAGGTEDPGPPQEVCGPRANQVVRQGAGRRGGVFHAASPSGASPAALATAAPCRRLPSSSLDEERNTGCVAAAAGSARQEHQCHRRTPRTGRAARTDPTLEPPPPPSSSTKSAFTARVRRQHCHVTGQSRTRECERGGGHRKLRVWRRLPPLL